MKTLAIRYAVIAFFLTLVASVFVVPVPGAIPSTYAAGLALLLGAISVTLMAWRNALPTDTVAQLLYRTESDDAARRAASVRRSRPDRG
jgi:Ca2+/Na+ antiporter